MEQFLKTSIRNETSFVYLHGLWSVDGDYKLLLFQSLKYTGDGGTVPGVFIFGAINVSSVLYTNRFTPKIKGWGSRRTVLDILVKKKICLSRGIKLQALCNTVQVSINNNNQFFRQNSSWIGPVQVN
jgi:hypothetical protein